MDKKKVSRILAVFFLVQAAVSSQGLSTEVYSLGPPTKVNLNDPQLYFKQTYDAIVVGLSIYRLDAVKRFPKEVIARQYADLLARYSTARFDLDKIDIGRKGWTRYYPFSVGEKSFIIRIFLTSESAYQPKLPILYEGNIVNPALTFQVVPGLNDLLSDHKVAPVRFYSNREVSTSP